MLIKKMKKHSLFIVLIIASSLTLDFSAAYCQPRPPSGGTATTDQLMREQKRIERGLIRAPKKTFEITPQLPEVKEEGPKIFVKKITLKGCESVPCDTFQSAIKVYENRELTMADINLLCREIEADYLKRGFITAVFVPPQEAKEGEITLEVVEAKMGDVIAEKPPFFNVWVYKKYWQLKPGETLRYDKMSKSLQMMNKNPDREVKAALKAGKKPKTTDVILTSNTRFPIHFTTGFDNDGQIPTGKYRTSFGIRDNNFLGLDDTLVLGTMFGDRFSGRYGYHSIPVSKFGTSILYGASRSESKPNKDFDVYDMRSFAYNENVSIHQDIYKKDEYLGEVFMGFDFKDKLVYANSGGPDSPANAGIINKDRLRVLSMGGTYIKRTSDSSLYATGEYDQGLRILGASTGGNPYASRDASSVYAKFLAGLNERSRLALGIQNSWKVRMQFAPQKLTPQEEFALGGIDSVRGYPPSDFSADTALLTTYEILLPAIVIPKGWKLPYSENTLRNQTSGVLFLDYGYGMARNIHTAKNMTGVGMGIRVNVYDEALVRIEYGWPIGDKPVTEGGRDARLCFAVEFQDKLPEDIERIKKMREEERLKKTAQKLVDQAVAGDNSPLAKRLASLKTESDHYKQDRNWDEYRKVNVQIVKLCESVNTQAEDYLRALYAHLEELKEYKKLAIQYETEGKHDDAKKLWEKIISETSTLKPLVIIF